jgi:hypothetical protein
VEKLEQLVQTGNTRENKPIEKYQPTTEKILQRPKLGVLWYSNG